MDQLAQLESALTRLLRTAATIELSTGDTVDRTSYVLLKTLGESGSQRLTALAGACRLDKSTVSRIVTTLEDRGLLERSPDPGDGRASLVQLTPHGEAVLQVTSAYRQQLLHDALAAWSDSDRGQLASLLTRLLDDLTDLHHGRADCLDMLREESTRA